MAEELRHHIREGADAISSDREPYETPHRPRSPSPHARRKQHTENDVSGAAIALVDRGEHIGLAADAFNTSVDRTQKLLAKSDSSAFVPGVSIGDIKFGFWCDDQLSGHAGRGPCVSLLPRPVLKPGFSGDSPFGVPIPVSASHAPVLPPAWPRGHPTDLPRVEASRMDLDRRSKVRSDSFGSPLSIVSNQRSLVRLKMRKPQIKPTHLPHGWPGAR